MDEPRDSLPSQITNILRDITPPSSGERFEELSRMGATVVERIVSSSAPHTALQVQSHDEWVALLLGEATLEVDGKEVRLEPGDSLLLPSGTPHRVLCTSAGALWLAVHVRPPAGQ